MPRENARRVRDIACPRRSAEHAEWCKPPHELAGQPFYFSGTCTGIGDVIIVNQSLARTAALRIVGGHGVVVEPLNGAPGIEEVANAECTITGGGFSSETIEPFDEPFSFAAFIVGL